MFPFLLFVALMAPGKVSAGAAADAANLLDARFVRDLHDKKIDELLTLYTADAVFVDPSGESSGAGLRALYVKITTTLDSDLHLQRTSLKHDLNTLIEDGTYTERLGHRDTGKVEDMKGTYRFTMHKDKDGQWRYSRMEWH